VARCQHDGALVRTGDVEAGHHVALGREARASVVHGVSYNYCSGLSSHLVRADHEIVDRRWRLGPPQPHLVTAVDCECCPAETSSCSVPAAHRRNDDRPPTFFDWFDIRFRRSKPRPGQAHAAGGVERPRGPHRRPALHRGPQRRGHQRVREPAWRPIPGRPNGPDSSSRGLVGYVGLQAHGAPQDVVSFRNIRILDLSNQD
jgi:hypothetical protein